MHELDKTGLRKVIASAIFDPGATEGYKGDRTLTEWQTDAVMRALSATTSAGVTEEQAPRVTDAMVEAACAATVLGEDEFGKPVHLSPAEARAALEASRVAPVSQKEAVPVVAAKVKPLDLSALLRDAFLAGRGLKDGDRLSDDDHTAWCAYDPERMNAYNRICAALYASPAPAGEQVGIKAEIFDWLETELSAIDCWYRGDPSYEHDAYWFKDKALDLVKQARVAFPARSALHTSPTPVSAPVGVVEAVERLRVNEPHRPAFQEAWNGALDAVLAALRSPAVEGK